eukprot:824734-Rhodomonas_salina.2
MKGQRESMMLRGVKEREMRRADRLARGDERVDDDAHRGQLVESAQRNRRMRACGVEIQQNDSESHSN